jgi:hypothetical protein
MTQVLLAFNYYPTFDVEKNHNSGNKDSWTCQ